MSEAERAVKQGKDPLARVRPLDEAYREGMGYKKFIPVVARDRKLGHNLGWGAQHVWESYLAAYMGSGETQWLDRLVHEVDLALANRDDVLGHSDYRGRVRPVWGTTRYTLDGEYHAWVTHNGYTIYQILRFVELVMTSPDLREVYGRLAERYLAECRLTADQFDDQWRMGPLPGLGHFIYPEDLPFNDHGKPQRPNHQHGMALALMVLAELTGVEEYRRKAEMVAAYFRSTLKLLPNGSYLWTYKPDKDEVRQNVKLFNTNPPEKWSHEQGQALLPESIQYAGLNTYFAYRAFQHGLVFSEEDMQAFSKTLLLNLWQPTADGEPRVSHRINGQELLDRDEDLLMLGMRWIHLATIEPQVYEVTARAFASADKGVNALVAHVAAANLDLYASLLK